MQNDPVNNMRLVTGLWMKHQPTVTAYIASVVRDRHHVEDIAQEVASAISMQVDKYDADRPTHRILGQSAKRYYSFEVDYESLF